ncbi:propionate catabolism operon regulatory protein PrpR [Aquabacterium sp. A3]|uniref:propionate catabolism operon regulatory protein PrpR n=1 Tax=Aquabacterium sp. A3 TaxID=3132829 RepID=UPI00311A314E
MPLIGSSLTPEDARPRIVAIGFKRIHQMLQALVPELADRATVEVLDAGFDAAVAQVRQRQAIQAVDVVVAAGSNGGYLRQHLELPVVLVKVGGFDVLQALATARQRSPRVGLVTWQGAPLDLSPFNTLFDLGVTQRTYTTEDDARACLRALQQQGIEVVVGPGLVADLADEMGLTGVFLYSMDAVREALHDAVEVARAARIEQAKRERLNTILGQLSDGVIAVDRQERIQTVNPSMARWVGVRPDEWLGRTLTEVCPELSLQTVLRLGEADVERIERVKGKTLIVNRLPIVEQGLLTGAVLTCQDPISIQRVDRHLRTRTKTPAAPRRHALEELLGRSPAIDQLRRMALSAARSAATVLLIGESGTGKELVAQGIHAASDRREMPFVALNCAALTETLLESELFGYEEGAFTGARRGGKIGLFEAAHRGTLFLDEVGEMPLSLQARLLRVLQEREVLRVGATEPTPVNVRVIAATHRDLREQVAQGLFRLDLFYRLNILRLDVPSLRQRRDDVPLLAEALHARLCHRLGSDPARTRPWLQALVQAATRYDWPGNVRELENLLERLLAYAGDEPGAAPRVQSLPERLRLIAPELFDGPSESSPQGLQQLQTAQEVDHLRQVLAACGGDRQQAARQLGISRTTLWRKLKTAPATPSGPTG